jgi:cytochrome o ubiquinol oxidase subunit 2
MAAAADFLVASRVQRPGRLVLLVMVAVALVGCDEGVMSPKGPIGHAEKTILFDATVIMLAVVIPVIVLTLAFAWWFRAGNQKARYLPDWEYSGRIEMIVWAIPALIVLFLGGTAWVGSHDLDPMAPIRSANKPLDVEVISMDWKWLFVYPEQGIATINELTVPVATPVRFRLTSATVMNSFFVPRLGSQIYTMAGMVTQVTLLADEAGTYPGRSVQFSGDGFSDMTFDVHAVSQARFDEWVASAKANGSALDINGYAELLQPSSHDAPREFSSVVPGLFDQAVMATMNTEDR